VSGHLLSHFVHRFGVLGVLLGAALEGETAVLVGGAAAHHGLFNPYLSAAAAFLGSVVADQLVFWASRHEQERAIVRRIREKPAVARALQIIDRHPRLFCFGFRFVYGFRIAGPAAVGASSVPGRTFVVLNALSALVWAIVFTWAGYRFGGKLIEAVRPLLEPPYLAIELGVFASLVLAFVLWRRQGSRG